MLSNEWIAKNETKSRTKDKTEEEENEGIKRAPNRNIHVYCLIKWVSLIIINKRKDK